MDIVKPYFMENGQDLKFWVEVYVMVRFVCFTPLVVPHKLIQYHVLFTIREQLCHEPLPFSLAVIPCPFTISIECNCLSFRILYSI